MPIRNAPTAEQLKEFIALRNAKKFRQIERFKKTLRYKWMNIFNILCFVIYTELIVCAFGPVHYDKKHCTNARIIDYGTVEGDKRVINRMSIWDENNKEYTFYVGAIIQVPKSGSEFYVGRDYFLNKELKIIVCTSENEYRLWYALSFLFLGIMVMLVTIMAYLLNMNLHNYSLTAITVLNVINMLYFISF